MRDHQTVINHWKEQVANERVPHAVMLCGQANAGLLATAIDMARELLNTSANAAAMLAKLQHPDLHFIYPVVRPKGTPSYRDILCADFIAEWYELTQRTLHFTLDEWLQTIRAENQQAMIFAAEGDEITHKLMMKSSQGGYKVCIIWLPERMHNAFANKILKLLEEPPAKTVFILVSLLPEQLLETIRSRVQRIDLPPIIDRQRTLDSDETRAQREEFHDWFVDIMRLAYKRDTKGMKEWSERLAGIGREQQRQWLSYAAEQIRESFVYNFHQPELNYLTDKEEAFTRNFAPFVNENNVISILILIDRTTRAIGQNAAPKMQFFDFALNFTVFIVKR